MTGVVLVTVGWVLWVNGFAGLQSSDSKGLGIVNYFGGALLIIINAIALYRGETVGDFLGAAVGFMVALTYLWMGLSSSFKLDGKPFGWFCAFTGIAMVLMVFQQAPTLGGTWVAVMWASWAILWFAIWASASLGKNVGKFITWTCVVTAFYTGLIPGLMYLVGQFPA